MLLRRELDLLESWPGGPHVLPDTGPDPLVAIVMQSVLEEFLQHPPADATGRICIAFVGGVRGSNTVAFRCLLRVT